MNHNILIITNTKQWEMGLLEGVDIETTIGGSIMECLTIDLGLHESYINSNIDAVFLDGHPVDDIDAAIITENNRLALAGALPGAAGIAMRRGSPVAALRGDITFAPCSSEEKHRGLVTLRIFGLVLRDIGAHVLARSVFMEPERILAHLVQDATASVEIDGCPSSREAACEALASMGTERVAVTVKERQ